LSAKPSRLGAVFKQKEVKEMVMRGPSITGFAVAILAMMLSAAPNAQESKMVSKPTHLGFLSCHVASGWGLVFGSSRKLRCTYSSTNKTKASEQYTGSINRFGTDIGYVQSGVIMWSVYAPEAKAATNPGFLAGRYQGQTASATVGTGVGLKNAIVGGPGRSIELHPVSIEGSGGLNLAAGVATIDLKFSPPSSPHR
jgi:hypothetical protein